MPSCRMAVRWRKQQVLASAIVPSFFTAAINTTNIEEHVYFRGRFIVQQSIVFYRAYLRKVTRNS